MPQLKIFTLLISLAFSVTACQAEDAEFDPAEHFCTGQGDIDTYAEASVWLQYLAGLRRGRYSLPSVTDCPEGPYADLLKFLMARKPKSELLPHLRDIYSKTKNANNREHINSILIESVTYIMFFCGKNLDCFQYHASAEGISYISEKWGGVCKDNRKYEFAVQHLAYGDVIKAVDICSPSLDTPKDRMKKILKNLIYVLDGGPPLGKN
jgi:hypothetical protein